MEDLFFGWIALFFLSFYFFITFLKIFTNFFIFYFNSFILFIFSFFLSFFLPLLLSRVLMGSWCSRRVSGLCL